jgi:hypothetical protein
MLELGIRSKLKRVAARLRALDDLTRLANKYLSDKGTLAFGAHYYTRVYHSLFKSMRTREITLLELGLLHPCDSRVGVAPSLNMWREYFPKARLIGFDINDFSGVSLPNCTIIRGDMGSRDDLATVSSYGPFDIIIDDASHASAHQQIALAALFPHVKPNGFYVIEDLNWQPPKESPSFPKTRDILRVKSFASPVITVSEAQFLIENVGMVAFFDTCDKCNLDRSDAMAVLVKGNALCGVSRKAARVLAGGALKV